MKTILTAVIIGLLAILIYYKNNPSSEDFKKVPLSTIPTSQKESNNKPLLKKGTELYCSTTNKPFMKVVKDIYPNEMAVASQFKQTGYFKEWKLQTGAFYQPKNCNGFDLSGQFYTKNGWVGYKTNLISQILLVDTNIALISNEQKDITKQYNEYKEYPVTNLSALSTNMRKFILNTFPDQDFPIVFLNSYKKEIKTESTNTRLAYYKTIRKDLEKILNNWNDNY